MFYWKFSIGRLAFGKGGKRRLPGMTEALEMYCDGTNWITTARWKYLGCEIWWKTWEQGKTT